LEFVEEAVSFESESDYCRVIGEEMELYCCPAPFVFVENPCTICSNGATAGYDFAPYASIDGDLTTCAELINATKLYEAGSENCGYSQFHELRCCYEVPENPCIICPNGASAGDNFVPEYEENTHTCKDLIDSARQFESESDACGLYDVYVGFCCSIETVDESTCNICPDGATAGDDFVPNAASGSNLTCGDLIYSAKAYEAESGWCKMHELYAAYCCPIAPMNPCVICSSGVSDSSTGPGGKTCTEIINFAKLFESGSFQCEVSKADESLCCPLLTDFPTDAPTQSPTSGISGGSGVSRLVWSASFASIVSILSVAALM
jgi:hypothetical protein